MAVHGVVARGRLGRRRVWIVGAAAVALLVVLTVAQTAAGARATTALGLTPPPQSYTELFVDSTAPLPGMLPAGTVVSVPVTFTLGNGSPDPASYRWTITQSAGSAPPAVLATGTTDVAAGVRRARTVPVTVSCTAPQVLLAIAVTGVEQPITRHVVCQAPRR